MNQVKRLEGDVLISSGRLPFPEKTHIEETGIQHALSISLSQRRKYALLGLFCLGVFLDGRYLPVRC
jgi:hypothetical protein